MFFVALSILALFFGLGLTNVLKKRENSPWVSVFEGFVDIFISCIILIEILPHCFEEMQWWTAGLFGAGFLSIGFAEWFSHSRWKWLGWGGFTVGFGLHAFVDGATLGMYENVQGTELYFLALAVLFHRLPVGAILGMGMGLRIATFLTSLIAISTVLGFFSIQSAEGVWLFPLQAFAAGVLGHIIFDHSISKEPKIMFRAIGAILAVILFFGLDGVEVEHGHHEEHHLDLWTIVSLGIMVFLTLKPRPNSENIQIEELEQSVN